MRLKRLLFTLAGFGCFWGVLPHSASAQHGWSDPVPLNMEALTDSANEGAPAVTPGADPGVWISFFIRGGHVYRTRSTDDGATWDNAVFVQSSPCDHANLASDTSGTVVAVWHNLGMSRIQFSRSTDDGLTWSAPASMPSALGGVEYRPEIYTDENGTFVVVNERHYSGGEYDILYARSADSGATWSNKAYINSTMATDGSINDNGATIAGADGTLVAMWSSDNTLGGTLTSGYLHLMFSRSTDNGLTWSPMTAVTSEPIAPSTWPAYWPAIAADGTGKWVAAMNAHTLGGPGVDYDIYIVTSSDDGATWSSFAPIQAGSESDMAEDRYPQLQTDRNGRWVCTYQSDDPLDGTIGSDVDVLYSESLDNGATWSPSRGINPLSKFDSAQDHLYLGDMKVDLNGNWDRKGSWMVVWNPAGLYGSDFDVVAARSVPDIEITTSPLDFGEIDVDSGASSVADVIIENAGLLPLSFATFEGIKIGGPDAAEFSFVNAPSDGTMPPGTTRTVSIRFDPGTLGFKQASLRVETDDPDEPIIEKPLAGTGVDQEITVTGGPITFFPRGTSDGLSKPESIIVRNDGTADLFFTGVGFEITGSDAADFVLLGPPSLAALAPDEERAVEVAFDPETAGNKSAFLTIHTDDTDEPVTNVPISSSAVEGFSAAADWQLLY